MKVLNKKINGLWQSRRTDMGKKGNLWLALLFGCIAISLIIAFCLSSEIVDKILYGYMVLAFSFLAITLVATYLYVYSRKKIANWLENMFKIAYKVLLCLCFVVCIPIMLFLKLMEIMLRRRAKKIDNYENWLIILVIDLIVVMLLGYINILVATSVATYIELVASFEVSTYPIILFITLSLIKGEWDIINTAILKMMNRYGMAKIKKAVLKKKLSISNKLPEDLDIKRYSEEKKQTLNDMEEGKIEELKYDIAYQKTTLWRFQLFCLIVLFLIATFAYKLLFENQSDAINVITVFTLIMLYFDKRRAWDKDVLGLQE